jgi:hypothetical protein
MNLFSRIIILIGILLLLLTLFPAISGTGYAAVLEEDDLPDDDDVSLHNDVPISWIRIPVHQLSLLLRLGISIFALFIVYLGGRSKARRFNDRTIDTVNTLTRVFFSDGSFHIWRSRLLFPVSSHRNPYLGGKCHAFHC